MVAEVKACEKKKELKKLIKANEKEFKGVDVDKYDSLEALSGAALKALGGKKEPKEKKAKKTKSRMISLCDSIKSLPKKGMEIDAFVTEANEAFMKDCGGEGNERQTKHTLNVILPVLIEFNVVSIDGDVLTPSA